MSCVCGYKSVSQIARHKKGCKHFAIHAIEQKYRDAKEECETYRVENQELRKQLGELKGRLEEARSARPNVNNNVTINIIPFGEEVRLPMEAVKPLMRSPSESVPRYIEMKHFRHRETANIRIPNKRGRTIQVVEQNSNGKRWVDKDRKEMLSQLTDTSLDELIEYYDAEKDVMWNNWFKKSRLNDDGYDKTDTFREIVRKVENVITSQRAENHLRDMAE